jgi:phage gpG-like protein
MFPIVNVKVEGLPKLESAFKALADGWVDLRRVEPKAVKLFQNIERQEFASSGGRSGGWTPLSPAYAARKAKTHPGQPILRRDDNLFKALTQQTGETVKRPEKDHLELGATGRSGQIGSWHQIGGGRLPARPLLAMQKEDEDAFGKLILDDAAKFARAEGFTVKNLGFSVL